MVHRESDYSKGPPSFLINELLTPCGWLPIRPQRDMTESHACQPEFNKGSLKRSTTPDVAGPGYVGLPHVCLIRVGTSGLVDDFIYSGVRYRLESAFAVEHGGRERAKGSRHNRFSLETTANDSFSID